ncbi:Thoeris anti-defense Tad2 family protein [Ligilactobacillus salivarius]|uniref:Thoeris anti-defense Tad2 family protein n=1 Tax=Ligilactobacillus salivarius TaxID=1624 RepID=UPI000E438045|nr:hypothetical protein [Ligilactobacillus salivarius]MYY23739.1 hypothetical protein [Ligilactobacillus salivarius]MYY40863.1 hypothetical protein [Ligilactobacillus salivarius]MYY57189.1 hypothetical protein [Ligilactobacillus salivarius]MYZ21231.1 hypothetical protein [Ligilactobacillus salivarius]MYZ80026.1 hypothetical protein [Ligilactobacillus salivarius]
MYINQAVKKALKSRKGMTRENMDLILFPTSSDFGCILVVPYEKSDIPITSVRWNPKAEDLLADDWKAL